MATKVSHSFFKKHLVLKEIIFFEKESPQKFIFNIFLGPFIFELGFKIWWFHVSDFLKIINFNDHGRSRSKPPEVFLGKAVLKICSKLRVEHPCRSVISIKLFTSTWVFSCKFSCIFSEYLSLRIPLTGFFWRV